MHGSVTTSDFLLLIGGIDVSGNTIHQLHMYNYACNQWTDLTTVMTGELLVTNKIFRCY